LIKKIGILILEISANSSIVNSIIEWISQFGEKSCKCISHFLKLWVCKYIMWRITFFMVEENTIQTVLI
jgi:hypothetical protein